MYWEGFLNLISTDGKVNYLFEVRGLISPKRVQFIQLDMDMTEERASVVISSNSDVGDTEGSKW